MKRGRLARIAPMSDVEDERARLSMAEDKFSLMDFVLILILFLLLLLPHNQGANGASEWAAMTPLRFEARRDYNLTGTSTAQINCDVVDGKPLPTQYVRGIEALARKRPPECSRADIDLYVRYIDPNGKVSDVLSMNSPNLLGTADGAFAYSEVNRRAITMGNPNPYLNERTATPFRLEELTYRHKYLLPGQYILNVHLERPDDLLPDDPVKAPVFIIAYEGTDRERVLFADTVTLTAETENTREHTVISFQVDNTGTILPESINLKTQVHIIEASEGKAQ